MYRSCITEVVHVQKINENTSHLVHFLYMYSCLVQKLYMYKKLDSDKIVHIFCKYVHVGHQKGGRVWGLRERIG